MCDTKYNGHANYQTWLAALWIDNDEGLSNMVDDLVIKMSKLKEKSYLIGKRIESLVNEAYDKDSFETGLLSDLLSGAWSSIDWTEIAESKMDDTKDEWNSEEDEEGDNDDN